MSELVTIEQVKEVMTTKSGYITQEAVDIINSSVNDPEFQEETLIKSAALYENVLKGTRASIPEYLNAIRFCAYMSTNDSNFTEAYKKVFMEREFVKVRANLETDDPKYTELTSAASRYRRTKLVVDILTVSQVPLDMIFSGYRYKAIGVLAEIMMEGRYDRDRIGAAKELLLATKNEDSKIAIEIGAGAGMVSMQEQLDKQLDKLAKNQQMLLDAGHNIVDVQKTGVSLEIIEGDFDEQ